MITILDNLFQWVLEISWQASLLALAVLLVQTLFRKWLNPRWYYALWLLVVLRLLLPVTPESPVSGYGYLPQAPINRAGDFAIEASPMEQSVAGQPQENPAPSTPAPGIATSSLPMPAEAGRAFQLSLRNVLSLIWLAGMVAWGLFILLRNLNFRRRLRALPEARHPVLTRALGEACALLRIKDRPRLVEAGFVASPCLTGVFRPVILLPADSAGRFNAEELRLILVHELAHYQRGDLIVQWIVTWLQAVHWFNPVLWFAFKRMRMDREPATDALVLDRAGIEAKQSYGNTLITLLQGFQQVRTGASVVGILEDKHEIKKRFQILSIFHRKAYAWSTLAVVLMAVLGLLFLTQKSPEKAAAVQMPPGDSGPLQEFRKAAMEGQGDRVLEFVEASSDAAIPLTEEDVAGLLNEFWDQRELEHFTHLLKKMRMTTLGNDWLPDEARLRSMVQEGGKEFIDVLLLDPAKPLPFSALKAVQEVAAPGMSAWIDQRVEAVGKQRENQDAFVKAAQKGEIEKMRELLAAGADINGVATNHHTALTSAAGANRIESVRFLLEQGALPDKVRHPGWDYTPLCLARSVEMADMLKAAGADVHAKLYRRNVSILTYAARWNGAVMVPWFIENGIDPHSIADNNQTLLFYAGDGKAMRYLLEKGLDVYHKDEFGRIALFSVRDEASVQAMIDYGLDLEKVEKETEQPVILMMIGNFAGEGAIKAVLESGKVDVSPATLQSALVAAAHYDNDKLIRFLVQHGADVNQPEVRTRSDGVADSTMPLMATTLGDQAKAAKALLELGADPNGGHHPGHFLENAMLNGSQKVAKLLREAGAKGVGDLAYQIALRDEVAIQALLDKAPGYATSPEFWDRVMVEAARTGHRGVIEAALQKGAPLFKDRKFMSSSDNPYRAAAAEGQHEVLELLIARHKKGEDDTWLVDALHGALWNCNPYENQREKQHFDKTVEVLLKSGIDLKKMEGKEAVTSAVAMAVLTRNPGGNGRVIEMLVAAGAEPNPVVEKGVRMVDYLQSNCSKDGCWKPTAATLAALEKANNVKFNFKAAPAVPSDLIRIGARVQEGEDILSTPSVIAKPGAKTQMAVTRDYIQNPNLSLPMGVIIDTVADFKDDKIAYSILLTLRDSASSEGDVAQKAISTFKTRELMLSGVATPGSDIDARLDEHTTLTISLEKVSPQR